MNIGQLGRNLRVAFTAQIISLVQSCVVTLLLPKFLGVEGYSFWQLFIFYSACVGFFHCGINDGVYLKYSGLDFSEMNRDAVSGQFRIVVMIQMIFAVIITIILILAPMTYERRIIFFFSVIYMVIFNCSMYMGYIFQAANHTHWYSFSVIIDKLFFLLSLIVLILFGIRDIYIFLCVFIAGSLLNLCYSLYKGRYFLANISVPYKKIWPELKDSIKVGVTLMLSGIASLLIAGIDRFFIDNHWGIIVFGKVSLALSLTAFALVFIRQVSMVFSPALRCTSGDGKLYAYINMFRFCFFLMPWIYFLMIPGKWLINLWLPNYADSVAYLAILLPMCIFDAKMNLVFITYFKVLRREKEMMYVNYLILALSVVFGVISVYVFNSLVLTLISMVAIGAIRCFISEQIIGKLMKVKTMSMSLYELLFAVFHIFISLYTENWVVLVCGLGLILMIQNIVFRDSLKSLLSATYFIMKSKSIRK